MSVAGVPIDENAQVYHLRVFNPLGLGTDKSATKAIHSGIAVHEGTVQKGHATATDVFAMGADGIWTETQDAALAAAIQPRYGYVANLDAGDLLTVESLAQAALDVHTAAAVGFKLVLLDFEGIRPWVDFKVGDVLKVDLTGAAAIAPGNYRVRSIIPTLLDSSSIQYELELNRLIVEEDDAAVVGLLRLLNQFDGGTSGTPSASTGTQSPIGASPVSSGATGTGTASGDVQGTLGSSLTVVGLHDRTLDPTDPTQGTGYVWSDEHQRWTVVTLDRYLHDITTGTVAVGTGVIRYGFPQAIRLLGCSAMVNTAPTGADLIVDINLDGTTVYTTQANRPTITAAANSATETVPDVVDVPAGSYLTVDIDQIGSTVAGADLTVTTRYTLAP